MFLGPCRETVTAARICAGAKWLDSVKPFWWTTYDSSSGVSVVEQIWGTENPYHKEIKSLLTPQDNVKDRDYHKWLYDHGFCDFSDAIDSWRSLWISEVKNRCAIRDKHVRSWESLHQDKSARGTAAGTMTLITFYCVKKVNDVTTYHYQIQKYDHCNKEVPPGCASYLITINNDVKEISGYDDNWTNKIIETVAELLKAEEDKKR